MKNNSDRLRIGFVPLVDCAPIVLAHETGAFESRGLQVDLMREPGWATIRDKIAYGELEAVHAPVGMSFAVSWGLGVLRHPCVTGYLINSNGDAITISKALSEAGVTNGESLAAAIRGSHRDRPLTFGIPNLYSTHHFLLLQWLRPSGIVAGRDVRIIVLPPSLMASCLASGNIDGYCVGEPFNSLAVQRGDGVILAESADISPMHPEKALILREEFAEAHHERHLLLIQALDEAARKCETVEGRNQAAEILSAEEYLDLPVELIRSSLFCSDDDESGHVTNENFHVFHHPEVNCPSPDKASWMISQMRHAGLLDGVDTKQLPHLRTIFRKDIYDEALGDSPTAEESENSKSLSKKKSNRKPHMKRKTKLVMASIAAILAASLPVKAELLDVEKDTLKFGFIKLTDCAPIVIAKEKGYFDDEGLSVTVEAQGNWKELLNRVITGDLDGAHMLAGQPIGATVGFGTQADIVTAYSLDYNGNGITVSNDIWEQMKSAVPADADGKPIHPITADSLKPIVDQAMSDNAKLKMGMVFPVSTHNYEIRYWLAAAGIKPGFYFDPSTGQVDVPGFLNGEVELSVTPPPQMPQTLEQGTIVAYCVGEPWNQQAVSKGIGVPVTTNYDIWKNNPEKVFGVSKEWAEANPNTWIAVTKALIRAGHWLDASPENRVEAAKILSQPNYVGAPFEVISNSMTGTFEFEKGDKREMPDFNVFFRYNASYPYYSDCVWFLTQMVRWGQIPEQQSDSFFEEMAKKIYRPDVYISAVEELIDDGEFTEEEFADAFAAKEDGGYKAPTSDFIDGKTYDGTKPNEYIQSFDIGLK